MLRSTVSICETQFKIVRLKTYLIAMKMVISKGVVFVALFPLFDNNVGDNNNNNNNKISVSSKLEVVVIEVILQK